jgi:hypothetical protein|tara:strand:+ start:286 stop:495 length:210 start_codon:yes stop_codon:yes gene_type:complete
MKDGPFKDALESDHGGMIIKQEFSTIKIVNGTIVKEIVTRDYDFYGDYIDSMSSQPLVQIEMIPKEMLH